MDEVKAGAIVLDSTFSNYTLSRTRVQEALNFGRNVIVQFVYRDMLEAYSAVITRSRAEGAGRTVSRETHRSTHANAAKTVARVFAELAAHPCMRFQFYESSSASGFTRGSAELTQREDYTREIIEVRDGLTQWAADDVPALFRKLALEAFEKLGFVEQAEYLAEIALASGNRYRGRAELLLKENPHRDFRSAIRARGK